MSALPLQIIEAYHSMKYKVIPKDTGILLNQHRLKKEAINSNLASKTTVNIWEISYQNVAKTAERVRE